MEEKQKKQLEIIHNALDDSQVEAIWQTANNLEDIAKSVLNGLSAFEIVQGHSAQVMATQAILQIASQCRMICTCTDENENK